MNDIRISLEHAMCVVAARASRTLQAYDTCIKVAATRASPHLSLRRRSRIRQLMYVADPAPTVAGMDDGWVRGHQEVGMKWVPPPLRRGGHVVP